MELVVFFLFVQLLIFFFIVRSLPSDSAGGFHNRGITIHHLLGDLRHRYKGCLSVDRCIRRWYVDDAAIQKCKNK